MDRDDVEDVAYGTAIIMLAGVAIVAFLAIVGAFLTAGCAIPSVSSIHLDTCLRQCDDNAKACLAVVNEHLDACGLADELCTRAVIHEAENCVTAALDCAADCTRDAEDALKQ